MHGILKFFQGGVAARGVIFVNLILYREDDDAFGNFLLDLFGVVACENERAVVKNFAVNQKIIVLYNVFEVLQIPIRGVVD